ncbi:hypothetical protein [Halanaerobium hydrogeniformans]|nr:hypothetical protein [Halanaerobium hydrogeniformans]
MREKIETLIKDFVACYQRTEDVKSNWREAIVRFADADQNFKELISPAHALATDYLTGAKTIIAYFLPYAKEIVDSNIEGRYSSHEWALAYIETNNLIVELDEYLKQELNKLGFNSAVISPRENFYQAEKPADWSHRHMAYYAGMGAFGLNNMLITDQGCCGRFGSIITTLDITTDRTTNREYCLYKNGEGCQLCVENCITNALKVDSFNGEKCYKILLYNDVLHSDIHVPTEVCGKCCVGVPCSMSNPVKI